MRRKYLEIVAAHPEIAAGKAGVVALVLQGHQPSDDLAAVGGLALFQREGHRRIGFDRADAIDARYRCHDDHIIALQQ